MKLCAVYKVFNAATYLAYSLRSVYDHVERIVVLLSTRPWSGRDVSADATEHIVRTFPDPGAKIRLVVKDWGDFPSATDQLANERAAMNVLLDHIRQEHGDITHYMYVDADEVFHAEHLRYLRAVLADLDRPREVRGTWRCYWKSFRYWIDPPEPSRPLVAFPLAPDIRFLTQRDTTLGSAVTLPPHRFCIHHFSYALPNDIIYEAKCRGPHGVQFVDGWWTNVWLAWDANRRMTDLHPCWPSHYRRAVRADASALPPVMADHPFHGRDIV